MPIQFHVNEIRGFPPLFDRFTYPSHATVNDEIRAVDEAAFVASEEEDGLGLLDGFTEAAAGKVDLAAVALGRVVAEPILEEGGARFGRLDYFLRREEKNVLPDGKRGNEEGETYLRGAGQSALNLNPSFACTIANSLVIANTAPLLAV